MPPPPASGGLFYLMMRRIFLSVLLLAFVVPKVHAVETNPVEVLPDSSDFVTASVLISSPGHEAFFTLGHSGLRLQCPSAGLDYCFSYSTIVNPGPHFNLLLLTGRMKAGFEALPYAEYMESFSKDGRGVTEYPLNLTLHEKQELWRLMDNKMMKGPTQPFDFLYNNCTSSLYRSVESIMESEDFDYPKLPPLDLRVRDAFHELFIDMPWVEFFGITMLSAIPPDDPTPLTLVLCPDLWGRLLSEATIRGLDGSSRPALSEPARALLPQTYFLQPTFWTPVNVFALLFAVVVVLTLAERLLHWRRVGKVFDTLLFSVYTFMALYLFLASCFRLYGFFWNWFLFVFNPIPLLLWIFCRKKGFYPKVWCCYSAVLLLFMVLYVFYMSQIEWAHECMLGAFLVRCLNRCHRKE